MDYPCAKFGDFSFSRSGLSCAQANKQTVKITDMDDRLTHATTVGASK